MQTTATDFTRTNVNANLERWIEQRTAGRVHGLRVETAGKRVIVHGKTGSYYVRQLALAAVLEGLESAEPALPAEIELDIQVGTQSVQLDTLCVPGRTVDRSKTSSDRYRRVTW